MHRVEAESIIKEYELSNTSLDAFIDNLQVKMISRTENTLQFDLINCHPSIANTLRRIMISKVPTMAIHEVQVYENNTVFPDEYIAHKLGLIPLMVDAQNFKFLSDEENFTNVLNFKIEKTNNTDSNSLLTSDDIKFVPVEGQEYFDVHFKPNVMICKMAPGNEIKMTLKATKGTGEVHAKWSPVSLCSYRLMPKIILEKDFYGEDARELQGCFSEGVIKIINGKAVVENPRLDMMSREVLRHEKFKDSVKILRESGWFCFTVESIWMDPVEIVKMGLNTLIQICRDLKEEVQQTAENCRDEEE